MSLHIRQGVKRGKPMQAEERTVTLRIKQRYLEEIAAGKKTAEYREMNEYYSKLFRQSFNKLKLHFQTSRQIIVEVLSVHIEERGDESIYCLNLGKVLEQFY